MEMHRSSVVGAVVVAVVAGVAVLVGGPVEAGDCWQPPVEAAVTDPFRDPGCPWCPGNRGIEYATRRGDAVIAATAGRVSFAGPVAGVEYVVVDVGRGRRVTYGRMIDVRPAPGDVVVRGQVIGRADTAFHLGVRIGEQYVDPAPFLGRLVHRPRLVPTDGTSAPPAPPPVLRCGLPSPAAVGAIEAGPGSMVGRFTVR